MSSPDRGDAFVKQAWGELVRPAVLVVACGLACWFPAALVLYPLALLASIRALGRTYENWVDSERDTRVLAPLAVAVVLLGVVLSPLIMMAGLGGLFAGHVQGGR